MTKIARVLLGAALAGLGQTAMAQDAASPALQPSASNAATQTTPTQAAPTPGSEALQEVVVTANKRVERLHDVPISVEVIDGQQLTNQAINQVSDLQYVTPAVNSAGPYGALSVRGIGSISFSRSAEGSVGVVVDGVSLANTSTTPPALFDISRVEVLEGPQGMLFGRNASGGLVNITTNAPDPSAFSVSGHLDGGTRSQYDGNAVVNIPVAHNAAFRLSLADTQTPDSQYNRYDGTYYNTDTKSARGRFLWQPSGDVTVNLIADYSRDHYQGGVPWTVYYSTPGSNLTTDLQKCGVTISQENQQGCADGGNNTSSTAFGFSGQVDWNIGNYTVTSITATRAALTGSQASDVDSVPVNILNENATTSNIRNLSQELRLTSPKGQLFDYVTGLYYFRSLQNFTLVQAGDLLMDQGLPVPLGSVLSTETSSTSYAWFGQGTFNITHRFRLIAGGRWGLESTNANAVGSLAPGAVAPTQGIAPVNGSVGAYHFSYRAGTQYDLSRNTMLYLTYTEGFKGPAVNDEAGTSSVPLIVRSEIPHAWEAGIKNTFYRGKLTTSMALFHTRVNDFQAQFYDPTAAAFVFSNAPKLVTKGAELNITGRLPQYGLRGSLGALYNQATYGSGYLVTCGQTQTAAQGCVPVSNSLGVQTSSFTDAGGNQLVGAPRWKLNASTEYRRPVLQSLGLEGFVQLEAVYTSSIFFDAAYDPIDAVAPATIFDGRLGISTSDGRYTLALFGRNLLDTFRPLVRFETPTASYQNDPASYSQLAGVESRRVVGLSLDASF